MTPIHDRPWCAKPGRVGGRGGNAAKAEARAWLELPLVPILVVVANIPVRTSKTEVEKGSWFTALVPG